MDFLNPAADRSYAQRLLEAYLLGLGIVDESARHRATNELIQAAQESGGESSLTERANDLVFRHTEAWISALGSHAPTAARADTDPLRGWRLRAMLKERGDQFLREPTPQVAAQYATRMNWASVPESHPADMPAQQLGDVPAALKKEFWRKAAKAIRGTWHNSADRPKE